MKPVTLLTLAGLLICMATARGQHAQQPFDVIEKAYARDMDPDDPLAFAMKIKSLAKDPYTFWRGSKDLFYRWTVSNATDWLADKPVFVTNHGDLHLGNIGTYAAEGEFGTLAFGMVDFDDSARLPFQFELLQGLITLHLTADQNNIALSQEQKRELASTLFETYRGAVNTGGSATDLLADDPLVMALMEKGRGREYAEELADHIGEDGRFKSAVYSKEGKIKEILRPADDRADAFAEAISQAIQNAPEMKERFRYSTPDGLRGAIRSIAQRTRLGSSGSQGLRKYFVLLDRPLKASEGPIILYLKQEISSAAERQGVIPRDARSPGARCADDVNHLTEPRPYLNSWCDVGDKSYWVHFKEPWSDELEASDVTDAGALMHAAMVWGTVAGAAHREHARFETILPRLTHALLTQIEERADAYLRQLHADFALFQADDRVQSLIRQADDTIASYTKSRHD